MKLKNSLTVLAVIGALAGCSDEDSKSQDCKASGTSGAFLLSEDTWTTGENDNSTMVGDDTPSTASSGCTKTATSSSSRMEDMAAPDAMGSMADEDAGGDGADSTGEMTSDTAGGDGKEDVAGDGQGGAGILTAGTFDDSVNQKAFRKFWEGNEEVASFGFQEDDFSYQWPAFDDLTIAKRFAGEARTKLELAMVVDATGSMGDELSYLQAEIEDISSKIKEAKPAVEQKLSLIVYRDEGDAYETRGIEFTGELARFQKFLNDQSAGGGGDYPEAMHTALEEATSKLQWSGEDTAKVLFLIADAPPHGHAISDTVAAIGKLKEAGVVIYPVAASGVAALAEKVMRLASATTGGEYIFITDDSGVGNPHAEPHVPCYQVRALNTIMIDSVLAEIEQKRRTIGEEDIIRAVGTSVDGVCQPVAEDRETPE